MQDKIIRLRSGRHGKLRPLHPWIYKRQILKTNPSVKPGDIVSIETNEGVFVGRGYYNPRSGISARIITFNDEPINAGLFEKRLESAYEKRKGLSKKTNAYRVVFSESDNLPGLIIDIYSDTAVFQVLTLGMEKFKDMIVESTRRVLRPKYIYEKSESSFRKLEGLKDIKEWHGAKGSPNIEIFEGKLKFLVDIENSHKTGFYLDQRNSRLSMENIAKGKSVLDLFCYTGAFSISAAAYGAASARGVDIKEEWLTLARKNAALNGIGAKTEFLRGDAFDILKNIYNSGEKFDIIIIDPPSFAKNRRALAGASRGYKELNLLGMMNLNEGGVLATFSCSHNMPNEIFYGILKDAARAARKRIKIVKRCHQAEDHPVVRAIPETEYLKGYFLEINAG